MYFQSWRTFKKWTTDDFCRVYILFALYVLYFPKSHLNIKKDFFNLDDDLDALGTYNWCVISLSAICSDGRYLSLSLSLSLHLSLNHNLLPPTNNIQKQLRSPLYNSLSLSLSIVESLC